MDPQAAVYQARMALESGQSADFWEYWEGYVGWKRDGGFTTPKMDSDMLLMAHAMLTGRWRVIRRNPSRTR
jgi:hypothetical protein